MEHVEERESEAATNWTVLSQCAGHRPPEQTRLKDLKMSGKRGQAEKVKAQFLDLFSKNTSLIVPSSQSYLRCWKEVEVEEVAVVRDGL